jgi:hypothetical protein
LAEQIDRQLGSEPRPEDLLGHRAEIDPSLPAVMLGLMALGSVGPNPARSINVDGSHDANLSRPHAGESRQFNHRPNLAGDVGLYGVNERIGDRPNRLGLSDLASAATETGDRLEAMMDRRGDHPLRDGPLVPTDDDSDPSVNLRPANASVDDRLANGLELERPEVAGQLFPVQFADRLDGVSDMGNLSGHLAILDVVRLGPSEERQE